MKLFELDKNWQLHVSEQAWSLMPFKKLLTSDKSKDKERANKEMLFIWFYADIKSDYQYIINSKERIIELKNDLAFPKNWKISDNLQKAIDFYIERSTTTSKKMLQDSQYIADAASTKLKEFMNDENITIADLSKIMDMLNKVPNIVSSLQETEHAVFKEQAIESGMVGSQTKGLFEDGIE